MLLMRSCLLLLTLLLSSSLLAGGYSTLSNRVAPVVAADKIEVTSIFSYGCPFCYQLETLLEAWAVGLPDDVQVVHLPAVFNPQWEHLARAYYVMEGLEITDQAHMRLFDRIHQDKANLNSQRALRNFFADLGVSAEEVDDLYSSFGVNSAIQRDTARLGSFRVSGVPALVVDGRYVIDGRSAGGLDKMLQVADQLIEQVRKQR